MNKLEALKELEGKVRGGSFNYESLYAEPTWAIKPGLAIKVYDAFDGSFDAAKALHEAVIHERVKVEIEFTGLSACQVRLSDQGSFLSEASSEESPARAWLLADIRALIAIEEEKQ